MTNKVSNKKESNNRNKVIMMIIVIIIIILSLLTSCSCTSDFIGKIGSLFINEGTHEIDPNNKNKKVIKNKYLYFDKEDLEEVELVLSDNIYKMTFSYNTINPEKFNCITSDASIATCYVENDYVVINTKSVGKVTVTVSTETNNVIYQGTANISIIKNDNKDRYISLSKYSATINLYSTDKMTISYSLYRLKGTPTITVEDSKIASAKLYGNLIKITAKKTGKTTITVSLKNNGIIYEKTFTLTVIKSNPGVGSGKPNDSKPGDASDNPIVIPPTQGKSSDSTLKDLTVNGTTITAFSPTVKKYNIEVEWNTKTINIKGIKNDPKATVTYTYNGKTVKDPSSLNLNTGDNKLVITVKAEDGTKTNYVVNIHRPSKPLSSDTSLTINTNKGTLVELDETHFEVDLKSTEEKITLTYSLGDDKSTITSITVNGKTVSNLNDVTLLSGTNTITITVKAEDGSTRTYTVIVNRIDNTLNSFTINGIDVLNSDYALVSFDTENFVVDALANQSYSTVTINGTDYNVHGTKTITPTSADTTITVVVKPKGDETDTMTYTVSVHRPVRTIKFSDTTYKIYIEHAPEIIPYTVYEDDVPLLNSEDKYHTTDITTLIEGFDTNIDGSYEVSQNNGEIIIRPNMSLKDRNLPIKITYGEGKFYETSDIATLKFVIEDYYVKPATNEYDMTISKYEDSRHIIMDTNMFTSTMKTEEYIDGNKKGIKIYSDRSSNTYVLIYTENNNKISSITNNYQNGNSLTQIDLLIKAINEGTAHIKGEVYVLGTKINEKCFDITLNITKKYTVTIYAEGAIHNLDDTYSSVTGGKFNSLTEEYEFLINKNEEIDLSNIDTPYLVKSQDLTSCVVYEFEEFSTNKDGVTTTSTQYSKTDIIKNITSDLNLYSMYSSTEKTTPVEDEQELYITDVDLFHNEEYFNKYNVDKIIYPGAHGYYIENLINTSDKTITLTKITLEEENFCVSDNGIEGCINMGYMIRYREYEGTNITTHYLMGNGSGNNNEVIDSNPTYEVLNTYYTSDVLPIANTSRITKNFSTNGTIGGLKLEPGEKVEISIFWMWDYEKGATKEEIKKYDALDTKIGSTIDSSDRYKLYLSFTYTLEEKVCKLG